jgi:MoaA/NifB/PqqE/SkfB family radical SAM enzyme
MGYRMEKFPESPENTRFYKNNMIKLVLINLAKRGYMFFTNSLMWLINKNLNRGTKNSFKFYSHYLRQFVEHSTLSKVANMAGIKFQKWLRIDHVKGMPYIYTIDPLNVCNLRCPLCPTGLGTLARKRGKLELEKYEQIIDQIAPFAYKVCLYNWGEPFLHPDIFEIIQYTSSRQVEVLISSNLNHFNAEMAEKTVLSGLDTLLVSVDGTTQDVYEKYRRKGNLSIVLNNLRLLVEAKHRLGSSKPFIYMRMLVNRFNENQIDEMKELCQQIGVDAFEVGRLYVDTTNLDQIKEWLPEKEQLSAYDYSGEKLSNSWHCVDDLWQSMVINWDGGVAPCCWMHDKKNDLSNVFEVPIKDLWNGDAYISSRRVFAYGGPKAGPVETICTRCKGHPQYLKD